MGQSGLDGWIEQQQRQFRDFDDSFGVSSSGIADFDTFPRISSFFAPPSQRQQALLAPPHPSSSSLVPATATTTSVNRSNNMALQSGESDMSPKAKVSYDLDKFQVEFNVQDYPPEELSIKTEGDVLIVLAKHETKAEGGQSFVSKQFEQRFSLPSGVKPEKISSSLSKDGFLMVTAPRDQQPAISAFKKKPVEQQGSNGSNGTVFQQSQETKDSYDDDKFQISLDAKNYNPEELDVKVEGSTIVITAKQEEQGRVSLSRSSVFQMG